jgi:hypothetical protein
VSKSGIPLGIVHSSSNHDPDKERFRVWEGEPLESIVDRLLANVFPEGRKRHALRLNVRLDNCQVHSLNRSKQLLMGILSLLFLIHHTLLTWRHPASPFSAISRYLLQIV